MGQRQRGRTKLRHSFEPFPQAPSLRTKRSTILLRTSVRVSHSWVASTVTST